MSVLLFIIALAVLVLAHEFGHFLLAKKNGIKVEEFGIGLPPRLWKIKKGETVYSVNLFPIGGFVKLYGEDGVHVGGLEASLNNHLEVRLPGSDSHGSRTSTAKLAEPPEFNRSFVSKSIGGRASVVAAGVVFNLILAWFLLSVGFMAGLPHSASDVPTGAKISDVHVIVLQAEKNSPAEAAGLVAGSEIIGYEKMQAVQEMISANKGKEIEIKYKKLGDKTGQIFVAKMTPRINPPAGEGAAGIMMDETGIVRFSWYASFWEGMKLTARTTYVIAVAMLNFFADAFRGLAGFESVSGPVGIAKMAGSAAGMGFTYFLSFVALLSINLAVINFIPFPALDGGRLLFLLVEKIKGSPINQKAERIVNSIGFALLLLLMVVVTYKDIAKLV